MSDANGLGLEFAFWWVLLCAAIGLVLSVVIERFLQPQLTWKRPVSTWAIHAGLWLLLDVAFVLVLGRPVFSMVIVSAFLLLLVVVNNAKYKALREPFVFQDYEYFTDAIRHPRLYIPFMGWGKFLAAVVGFVVAISIGLVGEHVPESRFVWAGQAGGLVCLALSGLLLLWLGHRLAPQVEFIPEADLQKLGFLAYLWRYAMHYRSLPEVISPFEAEPSDTSDQLIGGKSGQPDPTVWLGQSDRRLPASFLLPNLVSVQSESFFDTRRLWSGIRPEVLKTFDAVRGQSVLQGQLTVPAWGANTVRTEFAFLSGLDESALGVHRFNPYRAILSGLQMPSVATYLRDQGYRTICIHPYPAGFYQCNRVFPVLGFDEFIDIRAFSSDDRFGPYVGDLAVGQKITEILSQADQPTFIHAITMENHGPLHLERAQPEELEHFYQSVLPEGCDDLTIYLRHLRNADRMMNKLTGFLADMSIPSSLCWFGDHVPILPRVYDVFGAPNGEVDYFVWSSANQSSNTEQRNLSVHTLAAQWLKMVGVG